MKSRVKKNGKQKGFTLVELLAVITILSIVSTIVVYVAINVIDKAKSESYQVSLNNVEQTASNYALENSDEIPWTHDTIGSNHVYTCVTVKDLIDVGYFKRDLIGTEIKKGIFVKADDLVYLERDENKTIIVRKLLYDDPSDELINNYKAMCNNLDYDTSINFLVDPLDWSRRKNITIEYEVVRDRDEYKYSYEYDSSEGLEKEGTFRRVKTENVIVDGNGNMYANIINTSTNEVVNSNSIIISKIDANKPYININGNNSNNWSRSKLIGLSLQDDDSGFKIGSYNIYYGLSAGTLTCDELVSGGRYVTVNVDEMNSKSSSVGDVNLDGDTGSLKLYACARDVKDYVDNELDELTSIDVLLDNKGPNVRLGEYTETTEASGTIELKLVITDEHSGVNYGSFTASDLEITVGGNTINSENLTLTRDGTTDNYILRITSRANNGQVVIKVLKESVEDNVGNKNNEDIVLTPEISFRNRYVIRYVANGGTGTMESTECIYGENCTVSSNRFTYDGHTFTGWNTAANGSGTSYSAGYVFSPYNRTSDLTLYAQWRINVVTIKYHVNGGRIATTSNANGTWSTTSSIVYNKPSGGTTSSPYVTTINYGATIRSSGLTDYNNSNYVNISKDGYIGAEGSEWKCLSGCSGTFSQSNTSYTSGSFCNASGGDCVVTLGVNWVEEPDPIVKFIYNANGGTGTMAPTVFEYGVKEADNTYKEIPISRNKFIKSGYDVVGWKLSRTYNGQTQYYGCTNNDTCRGANTTIGWYPQSEIKTYYLPVSDPANDNYWTLSSAISEVDVTFIAQWKAERVQSLCTGGTGFGSYSANGAYFMNICFDRTYVPGLISSTIKITHLKMSFKFNNEQYNRQFYSYIDGMITVNGIPGHLCNVWASGPNCNYTHYRGEDGDDYREVAKSRDVGETVKVNSLDVSFRLFSTGLLSERCKDAKNGTTSESGLFIVETNTDAGIYKNACNPEIVEGVEGDLHAHNGNDTYKIYASDSTNYTTSYGRQPGLTIRFDKYGNITDRIKINYE